MRILILIVFLCYIIHLNAQSNHSPFIGFSLYNLYKEDLSRGTGHEFLIGYQYRFKARKEDRANFFFKGAIGFNKIRAYSERFGDEIQYLDRIFNISIGSFFVIDDNDYLYVALTPGIIESLDSPYIALTLLFEGIDIVPNTDRHKIQILLEPGILSTRGNTGAYIQFKLGIIYRY